MTAQELDKETYRRIIEDYFRAFETHDFSNVRFSTQIEFLSPIALGQKQHPTHLT